MSLSEREFLINSIVKDVQATFKTCLNCQHFNPDREICLKFQARPPAHVIAFGCPDFNHIVIPF